MTHDAGKTSSINPLIAEKDVRFIKVHLARPCGGKCASNWPTPARLWRR